MKTITNVIKELDRLQRENDILFVENLEIKEEARNWQEAYDELRRKYEEKIGEIE